MLVIECKCVFHQGSWSNDLLIIIKLHYTQTRLSVSHQNPILCCICPTYVLSITSYLFLFLDSLLDMFVFTWQGTAESDKGKEKQGNKSNKNPGLDLNAGCLHGCFVHPFVKWVNIQTFLVYSLRLHWSIFLYCITQYFSRWSSVILTMYVSCH